MTTNTTPEQYQRNVVALAAQQLTMQGCTLHAHRDGWDVERPDGSWATANTWQELARLARSAK